MQVTSDMSSPNKIKQTGKGFTTIVKAFIFSIKIITTEEWLSLILLDTKNIHTIKNNWKKMLKQKGAIKYKGQIIKEIKTKVKT